MTEIQPSDTLIDIAYKVGTYFALHGHRAVLTGGSCATFFAPEVYQSVDLDYIATFAWRRDRADEVVAGLGFVREGRIFRHPATSFTLDFPDDTVLIGDEFIRDFTTHMRGDQQVTTLTPTDCVRDRLLVYYTESPPDLSALRAAAGVAAGHAVDWHQIRTWSCRMGERRKFRHFVQRVRELRTK